MKDSPTFLEKSSLMRLAWVWALQTCIFAIAGVAAFLLRFDLALPGEYYRSLVFALAIWIAVKSVVFHLAKLDREGLRYVSIPDVHRLFYANAASTAISYGVIRALAPSGFPRSIYLIDFALSLLMTAGMRVAARIRIEVMRGPAGTHCKKTLIYGAGDAGMILLREIRNNPKLAYEVRGFIDDDRRKRGLRIAGIPVLGGGHTIERYVSDLSIEVMLIAIPSASGAEMTRILALCHNAKVECKTVRGLDEFIEGSALPGHIRDVAVDDLLGRVPVHMDESQIRSKIEGKIVLVTGAAGSIGSELCRQVARFDPAGIVGFEVAESPLFELDREMQQMFPRLPFVPEIGSIQNRERLDEVLRRHKPEIIFHAAAYKHVPLMEEHVFEAIENNVFGTFNVARSAAEHGVEDFVMISSDKAVRPTSIMGATKRIAELLLLSLQNGSTQYVTVRFGNVLGSNGSVIPIFKKQIAAGGPITVTHPDMQRFFMTIPEACQLVLQAAAIGEGGQICVLDMGQAVKIVDLARNLILLSGLRPDEDIKIEFTGLRPGEKLYEELSSLLEDTVPTRHDKIRIFAGNGMPSGDAHVWLQSLHEICEARDMGRLLVGLKEIVLDYSPSIEVLKRAVKHTSSDLAVASAGGHGVEDLSPSLLVSKLSSRGSSVSWLQGGS